MDRRGITEIIAMKLTGHKTSSVYQRYNIVSDRDLEEAAGHLEGAMVTNVVTNGPTDQNDYAVSSLESIRARSSARIEQGTSNPIQTKAFRSQLLTFKGLFGCFAVEGNHLNTIGLHSTQEANRRQKV